MRRHDTQPNDIHDNDTQQNDIQHNNKGMRHYSRCGYANCYSAKGHNWIPYAGNRYAKLRTFSIVMLYGFLLTALILRFIVLSFIYMLSDAIELLCRVSQISPIFSLSLC